jgi:hypothetical protein
MKYVFYSMICWQFNVAFWIQINSAFFVTVPQKKLHGLLWGRGKHCSKSLSPASELLCLAYRKPDFATLTIPQVTCINQQFVPM